MSIHVALHHKTHYTYDKPVGHGPNKRVPHGKMTTPQFTDDEGAYLLIDGAVVRHQSCDERGKVVGVALSQSVYRVGMLLTCLDDHSPSALRKSSAIEASYPLTPWPIRSMSRISASTFSFPALLRTASRGDLPCSAGSFSSTHAA